MSLSVRVTWKLEYFIMHKFKDVLHNFNMAATWPVIDKYIFNIFAKWYFNYQTTCDNYPRTVIMRN